MKVPEYSQQYKTDRTPQAYVSNSVPYQAFRSGADISRNVAFASRAISDAIDDINKAKEDQEKNKIIECSNIFDNFADTTLYNKDNGYYTTVGKNAVDNYEATWTSLEDKMNSIVEESNLSVKGKEQLANILTSKKQNYYQGLNNHYRKNDLIYKKTVLEDSLNINTQKAVFDRNDDNLINIRVKDVQNLISAYASMLGYDEETEKLMTKANTESLYVSVLNQLIADDTQESIQKATAFLEKNKNNISAQNYTDISTKLNRATESLKNKRNKEEERILANKIFSTAKDEEEALQIASKIENVETSDSVTGRLKVLYSDKKRFENQKEADRLNNFYTEANRRIESGEALSYDMIDPDIAPDTKLSLKNYIDKLGNPETDNQIWEDLYDMRINNAQGFSSMDLYKYRGYLSESDFRYFLKEQENIKTGNFYTNIKDDDKMINAALKEMKLDRNTSLFGMTAKIKDISFSEIKSFVREFEARKGRSITDNELKNFISDLGYKGSDGVPLYKEIERGMRERTNFIKDVTNDFVYFAKKHNGQMPSNEEKEKIIKYRLEKKQEEKKTRAQQIISNYTKNAQTFRNISNTVPKPNEQKILTSFAEEDIPQISKKLGFNLRITSRYRNDPKSKHGQGRALDIGLADQSNEKRIKIYGELLAHPKVYKLGCSDTNILAKYGHDKSKTNYNPKIVDERQYDKIHGTNHVNHVHVTLYNDKDYINEVQKDNGIYRI